MIPGFKTGPHTWDEGKRIVEEDGAAMGEIWFNVNEIEQYDAPLRWFVDRDVKLGLHHWGLTTMAEFPDVTIKPNLATHHTEVRKQTLRQIRTTIEYAESLGAVYVNAHPGARHLEQIDFATGTQAIVADAEPTSVEEAERLLLEAAKELHQYATDRDVLFTIETLPARENQNYKERRNVYDAGSSRLSSIAKIGAQGNFIANDISHTTAHFGLSNESRDKMWQQLLDWTKTAAPHTKLLHVNTMAPPFNGTDSHDGITSDDFAGDVFPTRDQLIQWLQIFKDRDDVYAVLEPRDHMAENYRALVQLLTEL